MTSAPPGWICPDCGRRFGRRNQSHTCAPAESLAASLAARSPEDRAIFEAAAACLDGLEPLEIEAVTVGIFFKKSRTFAELRPRRQGFALSFLLSRRLHHPRITRVVGGSGRRLAHFVHLRAPADVDEEIAAWLIEAYEESPE